MEFNRELVEQRVSEMTQLAKDGKLCGVGTLALMILKASLLNPQECVGEEVCEDYEGEKE